MAAAGTRLVLLNNSDEVVSRERLLALVGEHFHAEEVPVLINHTSAGAHGNDGTESGATEVFILGER